MKRMLVLLVLPLVFGLPLPAAGQGDRATTVAKILTTGALWGKDFPAAVASLYAWSRVGEPAFAIFPDRVVGVTPFKTPDAGKPSQAALSEALSQARPSPTPAFVELLKGLAGRPLPLQSEVVPFFDDDSYRVALAGAGLQLLAPGLTVEQVETLIGKPDIVTKQLIQSDRDRRPVILTLHSYADGTIVFAESDWAPRPGLIDRVILNVPVLSGVVFKGGQ